MLVLDRKEGDRTVIGRDIVITVVESRGKRIRLGITAPNGTPIDRGGAVERLVGVESQKVDCGHGEESPRGKQASMIRDNRPRSVDGDGQAPGRLPQSGETAVMTKARASAEWQSRLRKDRPIYGCPKCREAAMQFFATHEEHPGRSDFFCCSACGRCWEI